MLIESDRVVGFGQDERADARLLGLMMAGDWSAAEAIEAEDAHAL